MFNISGIGRLARASLGFINGSSCIYKLLRHASNTLDTSIESYVAFVNETDPHGLATFGGSSIKAPKVT
jgi:hypothetical protein